MKKSTRFWLLGAVGAIISLMPVKAQAQDYGRISGSFETNSTWYVPDTVRTINTPDDRFGSNNYLKLDYSLGKFTAGVQFEMYAPVLQGYDTQYKGSRLTNKYATWTDDNFSVTVGDYYDQFGSGMVFRAWEDRALGFNNALEGARVTYNLGDVFYVKGIWGRGRMYMSHANSQIRGLDGGLALSSLFGMERNYLALEGSYVNRYQALTGGYGEEGLTPNLDLISGRLNFEMDNGFSAKFEYVDKGKAHFVNKFTFLDEVKKGSAQLLELSYNNKGLGILATARRLDHMTAGLERSNTAPANVMNYLPALTLQNTYMLTTLDPYQPMTDGEQGGQLDIYYNFRKGSTIGGKSGMKVHLNGSVYFPLENKKEDGTGAMVDDKINAAYADITFDVEKKWGSAWKAVFLYNFQTKNIAEGTSGIYHRSHIFVGDVLYRFSPRNSVRLEAQYLYTKDVSSFVQKDWIAGLLEFNFAPSFSVFVSDMYNFGNDNESKRIHYYSAGVSYTQSRTRLALTYGRNRAGYVCSGGVCRMMPAYTGLNISLTTSF